MFYVHEEQRITGELQSFFHWLADLQLRRTCGGGRPPAASGQSGNMTFRWGVLHWQAGEGLDVLQLPFRKTSATDWSTGGVNQLDSVGEQGNDLTGKSMKNGK